MNIIVQSKLLISAGVIASASAIWHLLCIFGGPSWFVFARAPQQIIESAQQGTMLAPISTVFVASLMFACTVFSFSAAGLIRKVPLLKSVLITIASLCMLRGLITIASLCMLRGLIAIPTLATSTGLDIWQIVASTAWFYVGICFLAGSIEQYKLGKSGT
ncbi:hypothetical protein [Pseudocolwellia agarivorans]|uniref:hypothetical protein n=1 Tax=Pseudocolwellia agarivorans TaxID=1911682 RepID=UPI003F882302